MKDEKPYPFPKRRDIKNGATWKNPLENIQKPSDSKYEVKSPFPKRRDLHKKGSLPKRSEEPTIKSVPVKPEPVGENPLASNVRKESYENISIPDETIKIDKDKIPYEEKAEQESKTVKGENISDVGNLPDTIEQPDGIGSLPSDIELPKSLGNKLPDIAENFPDIINELPDINEDDNLADTADNKKSPLPDIKSTSIKRKLSQGVKVKNKNIPGKSKTLTKDKAPVKRTSAKRSKRQEIKKKKTLLWIGISILIILFIIAGTLLFINLYKKNQEIVVPKADAMAFLADRSINEPCLTFTEVGLNCTQEDEYSKLEKDVLISQSPNAGEIAKKGDSVVLKYSIGPKTVKLPNLTGMTVENAVTELNSLGLEYGGSIMVDNTDVPKDTVIRASVKAGNIVLNGTKIYLTVSNGSFVMPDWVGLTKDEVLIAAENLNVEVGFIEAESDQPTGIVIAQSIDKGDTYNNENIIWVTISQAKEVKELTMPDVLGMTEEKAQIELALAGFQHIKIITEENATKAKNSIVETIPAAGEKIDNESVVTLIKAKDE